MTPSVRRLEAGRVLALRGAVGRVVRCLSGVVWVTQEGDAQDHLLARCEEMRVERGGILAIQALRRAEVVII